MEDPLELKTRRRIYEEIAMNPGLHYRELQRRLNMPPGQLDYHLSYMVKREVIVAKKEGNYTRYYPSGRISEQDKRVLALLRQEIPRSIVIYLLLNPSSTHKELLQKVKVSGATLSYHLKKLAAGGVVEVEERGRERHYTVRDPDRVASILITYRKSFLDSLVDTFVRAWALKRGP